MILLEHLAKVHETSRTHLLHVLSVISLSLLLVPDLQEAILWFPWGWDSWGQYTPREYRSLQPSRSVLGSIQGFPWINHTKSVRFRFLIIPFYKLETPRSYITCPITWIIDGQANLSKPRPLWAVCTSGNSMGPMLPASHPWSTCFLWPASGLLQTSWQGKSLAQLCQAAVHWLASRSSDFVLYFIGIFPKGMISWLPPLVSNVSNRFSLRLMLSLSIPR